MFLVTRQHCGGLRIVLDRWGSTVQFPLGRWPQIEQRQAEAACNPDSGMTLQEFARKDGGQSLR